MQDIVNYVTTPDIFSTVTHFMVKYRDYQMQGHDPNLGHKKLMMGSKLLKWSLHLRKICWVAQNVML